jgi:hypothetical protein
MTMVDIKLDRDTHDLDIVENDIVLVTEEDEYYQNLKIRLQTIYGEWFLDTTEGVKYYEEIWIKNPNLNNIEALLKATILETENTVSIIKFEINLVATTRILEVDFTVQSTYGTVTFSEELVAP